MKQSGENKMFLEGLFQLTPNLFSKYKRINNKWSKEPQEIFLKAELEMRIYLGMAICFWIAAAVSFIFFLLALIQFDKGNMIFPGIFFSVTTYSGFVLMNMSNKKENESNLEKLKYREALMNKKTTVRRMQELETICERGIRENITRHSFNNYLDDPEAYLKLFQKLLDVTTDTIQDVTNVYETNKYYDYNINEQFEIETFYTVDAFKESEIITNYLTIIEDDLKEIALLIRKRKDPITLVNKIELLLNNMSENKVKF
jgi:hypothetical protein